MKKVLIVFIIITYSNTYLGCVSTKQTAYSASELTTNNEPDIDVVTKSSGKFRFKSNTYQTIGDTLVGQGRAIIEDEEQKLERINIALSDISYYSVNNEKHLSTWTYAGIGLGISIIVLAIINEKTIHID